jgi:hypothetical protein
MADTAFLRRIAADSSTDPRTVKKYLEHGKVSGLAHERITYTLIDRGHTALVRAPVAESSLPKSRA